LAVGKALGCWRSQFPVVSGARDRHGSPSGTHQRCT
jgi:hypothetical protein